MSDKSVTQVFYSDGYRTNTPDDIVQALNAACRVAFDDHAIYDTPAESRAFVEQAGPGDYATFKITVEKLP